jgi:hypothetical protein
VGHEGVGPIPQGVELVLVVQLNGNHHPIGHALGTDITVADIHDVSKRAVGSVPFFEVHRLAIWIAVKQTLPGLFNLVSDLRLGIAPLDEEVAPLPRGHGARRRRGWSLRGGALPADLDPVEIGIILAYVGGLTEADLMGAR